MAEPKQIEATAKGAVSRTEDGPGLPRGLALAAALVIVTIAVVALLLSRPAASLIPGQPPGVLDEYVEALQANDAETAAALLSSDLVGGFTPWLVGTDTSSLEVSDCENVGTNRVRCATDFGPNWFYSRITDEELITTVTVTIDESELDVVAWPPPSGLYQADATFGVWVRETHPDLYDEMYDGDIKYGFDSGAQRSQLADEYLESRG